MPMWHTSVSSPDEKRNTDAIASVGSLHIASAQQLAHRETGASSLITRVALPRLSWCGVCATNTIHHHHMSRSVFRPPADFLLVTTNMLLHGAMH
mmetsp:Transcript_7500/g.23245  ORF Transcript_7500/g.23245 Transcript_7500/m.23245 type:complete len:95 (-) Transcript_7500:770-1054(-)